MRYILTRIQGETVGAYTSLTFSLTVAFMPSSCSRRLLQRMLRPPHSCLQGHGGPRQWASEDKKEQVARSAITWPPEQSQRTEHATPQLQLLSAKGRGYPCCTRHVLTPKPPALSSHTLRSFSATLHAPSTADIVKVLVLQFLELMSSTMEHRFPLFAISAAPAFVLGTFGMGTCISVSHVFFFTLCCHIQKGSPPPPHIRTCPFLHLAWKLFQNFTS